MIQVINQSSYTQNISLVWNTVLQVMFRTGVDAEEQTIQSDHRTIEDSKFERSSMLPMT